MIFFLIIFKILQRAFFDVRVFNPFANSHLNQKLNTAFTASPLVFTPYGGGVREAERFIAELAAKIVKKKKLEYSSIMHWLRVKLSFNLVKSPVLCLRGSRTIKQPNYDIDDVQIFNNNVNTLD